MVADSRAQMNKFMYEVSDLMKNECRNAMLLGDMNISRLMTHAQQVKGDKLREHAKETKKARTCNYEYSQQKSGGGNCTQFQQNSSTTVPSSASVPSPRFRNDQKGGNNGRAQSTTSAAPAGHQTQQGNSSGTVGGQRQNKLYAFQARQDQEDSPDVVTGGIHKHHPRIVGGPTVRPAGPWFMSANSPRTQREIRPSVDPRPDLRSVGQVTDRGSCPWINAP
uniref:Gag-pol polyprotein n=1 Tax=Solanum tuberosum TaxID=4113 RepID=M1DCM4_SOLTU